MGDAREIVIEGAELLFINFAGREGPYNTAGDRNFGVRLDEKTALAMIEDGWNVKYLKPRDEEDDEERPWIPVQVSFKNIPPAVYLISSGGRTKLGEDMVEILDTIDIKTVDLILNPYHWTVRDKSGIKAYLKSIYVTILEDPLELKYKIYDDPPADD